MFRRCGEAKDARLCTIIHLAERQAPVTTLSPRIGKWSRVRRFVEPGMCSTCLNITYLCI